MVTVDGRKMGKSLGNFITLKDAFSRWDPQVVRFFILQSHYRSTLDFSNEAVEGAAKGYWKLMNTIVNLRDALRAADDSGEPVVSDLESYRSAFVAAIDDDVNTPQAIAVLFDLAREINQALSKKSRLSAASLREADRFFRVHAENILGLFPGPTGKGGEEGKSLELELVDLLVSVRRDIRAAKLWSLSDKIRDALAAMGIVLEDRKEGTTWKKTH
jgi:cysteinyl-tRNA synthetase